MTPVSPLGLSPEETAIRQAVCHEARSYLGVPYVWGGQSRDGIDCSGLVLRCLEAAGTWGDPDLEDTTAAGLWVTLERVGTPWDVAPGDLAFYRPPRGRLVSHVVVVVADGVISASGGRRGMTASEAVAAGARVRRWDSPWYRAVLLGYTRPWRTGEGVA